MSKDYVVRNRALNKTGWNIEIRKITILKQNGYSVVNTYVQEDTSDSKKMVFVSEAIENIAPGCRARETYLFLNENEFIERFELAEPGKEFALYTEAHLKRMR